MFKKKEKNLLSKEYMADKYYVYDREFVYSSKKNFIGFLSGIEEEFYSHEFYRDDRYVCVGRHRFLIKEMEELYYTKERCKMLGLDTCPTVWCLDSLIEMISNNNFVSASETIKLKNINSVYLNKTESECHEIYESYNKDGIISLNERDCILHAINMIKDSLDKCDENLEWR